MKKILLLFVLMATAFTYTSCSDDDDTAAPIISFPSTGQPVKVNVGENLEYIFSVEAEGGYKSHEIKVAGGIAIEPPLNIPNGQVIFTVEGTFVAGDVPGPGAITITVTDNKGRSTTETMALDIRKI